ncbi:MULTISPECIES: lipoprotein LpqH [Mycobacterium]|nr:MULTISPECIES: lipoprotein LpqH [Mycobacterium]
MRNRMAAVAAAAAAVAVLGACSTPSQHQLASTATVTLNGHEVHPHLVRCYQQEWFRTIELGDDASGAKVVLDQRDHPATALSVRFHNLGGFTGDFARNDTNKAGTRFDGETFTITGTANGANTAKPNEATSVDFKIAAKC